MTDYTLIIVASITALLAIAAWTGSGLINRSRGRTTIADTALLIFGAALGAGSLTAWANVVVAIVVEGMNQ